MRFKVARVAFAGLMSMAVLAMVRPAHAQDTSTSIKIAVCDPTKVLNEIQEGKDTVTKWKQDGEALNDQAKQKKDQLQTMQDELKLILPTSPQYPDKMDAFTKLSADTQAWFQSNQMILQRKQRTQEKELFDKILAAINQVAQAKGDTLVINNAHPDFPDLEHLDANAFYQVILMHTSLYADPKLDITEDVVIAMDKAYTK
jgi:Skp family chaperone for outer membrane proteins